MVKTIQFLEAALETSSSYPSTRTCVIEKGFRGMIADSMPQCQAGSGDLDHTSHVVLQFPTIPVDGTPARWLSHSQLVAMASNPDYSSFDDTSSSLGDSTYDFVDDKSGIVSDDEDHDNLTHSVSSNDERELPQVNRPQPPTLRNDGEASAPSASLSFSCSLNEAHSLPAGSGLTIRGLHTGDETNGDHFTGHRDDMEQIIVLGEPSIKSMDPDKPFEGQYTLKMFKQSEASEVMTHHVRAATPSTTLSAVVKQTMVKQGMIPKTPYKVLYVGDPSAREDIVWKIGSALDASSTSEEYLPNQYAVVRIPSFEDAMTRGVELIDSTGINLIIEECNSASFTRIDNGNDTISLTISNQASSEPKVIKSVWTGSRHRVTENWSLPDIAVIYLSESDNIAAKQTRHFARKFMSRHQVPCIVISHVPLWDRPAEIMALDYTTLHICLEAHDTSTSIVKRLPVNLETFMNLDAYQMNRNLAYLGNKHKSSKRTPRNSMSGQGTSTVSRVDEDGSYFSLNFPFMDKPLSSKHLLLLKRILLPGLFLILGLLLHQVIMSVATGDPNVLGASILTDMRRACGRHGSAVPTSLQSDSASVKSPLSSSHEASMSKNKSPLASNLALTSFLQGRQTISPNKSENFQVGIIGDCHIILRPPYWFMRSRKTHKLAFNVTRKGSGLHHQVSMPFDGVYALEIPREDAYGTLNVSLWTTSKPTVNETFQVDFGTSWLKASVWNRAEQFISSSMVKNRDMLQAAVKAQYDRFATKLDYLASWRLGKADDARKGAGNAPTASANQTTQTTDRILSKTIDLSRNLFGRLGNGSKIASKQMISHAKQLRRGITDIAEYSTTTSLLLLEGTQRLSQAVTSNIRNMGHHVVWSKNAHLRTTQKRALKFWWKIRGLPKQGRLEEMDRGKPHMSNGRFTGKIIR